MMGKNSAIVWTSHTFNPWWGCTKLVDRRECDECYAEAFARRVGRSCWGPKAERRCASPKVWADPYAWDRAAAAEGKQASVFCMSMGDLFEARADLDQLRERAWKVMRETPHLTWLLLTKRVHEAFTMLPNDLIDDHERILIGATIGTQKAANEPVEPVDFISAEPLLEHVDFHRWLEMSSVKGVIFGVESRGSRLGRRCPEGAMQFGVRQAKEAGKRVLVKQVEVNGRLSHDPSEWPEDLRLRELGWSC